MNIKYYEDDDILVQRFNNNPIVREVSQSWNINISYDKDGNIVQIVILEAKEKGLYPAKSLRGFLQYTGTPVPIDQLCKPVEYTDITHHRTRQI
ncbi:DUF2283 domain-containing protein [Thiothrix winogradskyi]|uniref:DUF2283 domain-containing protein n=1 Tax=Thiothrix winogradskyi TaxID=96472 RepID=A0ABY3SUU0_9GAMM|nr:DUF2283 domain-containing protein [Thiothrix winogradskyi]UJS22664.1 DUF2283 domain-containing protein [Thiothrix winogradskyi]